MEKDTSTVRPRITKKKSQKVKNNRPAGHSTKSKRVGRPRIGMHPDDIYKMAQCGLTENEMAHILGISRDTLQNFRGDIQRGRAELSQSIKRTQLQVALGKQDRQMLIWVGKQYAGQREQQDIKHEGEFDMNQIVFYGNEPPQKWADEVDEVKIE